MIDVIILSVGFGLLCSFTFPCMNGPLDLFKALRKQFGKPFSCPICIGFWGTVLFSFAAFILPLPFSVAMSAPGWLMLLQHATGYVIIYEGMDD